MSKDRGNDLNSAASKAWLSLGLASREPDRVELLSLKNKSSVHRLVYNNRSPIIAKRCMHWGLRVERTIYERVSNHLPVKAPSYYGCIEEDNGEYYWLFLEDIRGIAFDLTTVEHQVLAATWLARVHSTTAEPSLRNRLPNQGPEYFVSKVNGAAEQLPDRGPAYYRTALERGVDSILPSTVDAQFSAEHRALLKNILKLLDNAEKHWPELERICGETPRVIAHGDFVAKNLRVQFTPEASLVAFDWESAGWASPAMDFGILQHADEIAIAAYCTNFGESWKGIDIRAFRKLIGAGVLCRAIASVHWQSGMLDDGATWDDMQYHAKQLSASLTVLGPSRSSSQSNLPMLPVRSEKVRSGRGNGELSKTEPRPH